MKYSVQITENDAFSYLPFQAESVLLKLHASHAEEKLFKVPSTHFQMHRINETVLVSSAYKTN